MSIAQRPQSTSDMSKNKLREQVIKLRRQLKSEEAKNRALWLLLEEITDRMQISSAGIKAAVTSLLDYDIVWDGTTEHDFLEITNNNVDIVSREIMLITLASKIETKQLELVPEPNSIEEIISNVVDILANQYPDYQMEVDITANEKPVFVDYDYVVMALLFLLEFIAEMNSEAEAFHIGASEVGSDSVIQISGVNHKVRGLISSLEDDLTEGLIWKNSLKSTDKLKLFVLGNLFIAQNVEISTHRANELWEIHLAVPVVQGI